MLVAGHPVTTIAAAVGRTPGAVRAALDGELAPKVEEVRALVYRETAVHFFEMLALMPQARLAIQQGLLSVDEKLRLDTAWRLLEATIPKPAQRQEHHHSGSLAVDLSGILTSINEKAGELLEANPGGRTAALARVRTGPDALPRPVLAALESGEPTPDTAA